MAQRRYIVDVPALWCRYSYSAPLRLTCPKPRSGWTSGNTRTIDTRAKGGEAKI